MERKAKAKALFLSGETLKEASKRTGLSIDQLKKYSSNENWKEQQNEFYNILTSKLLEELGENHINARIAAFKVCEKIIKDTAEITKDDVVIKKETADRLKAMESILNIINKAISGETKILNLLDINVLYKTLQENQGGKNDKRMNIQEVEKVLAKIKGVRVSTS